MGVFKHLLLLLLLTGCIIKAKVRSEKHRFPLVLGGFLGLPHKQKIGVKNVWVRESEMGEE